jgi:16S rRNA (cytidine1402-2'-O)-methyltransferase
MHLNSPTPDATRNALPAALYVVATPIGNRGDITIRALDVLRQVDIIAAEDTRATKRFLAFHNLSGKLISYHEHNETQRTPGLIDKLKGGVSVALVSKAGTPTVSDPGYRLLSAAIGNSIPVIPIPGPSAATAALSVSGLPTDSYVFVGFPPAKKGKRQTLLEQFADEPRTIIFYESPKRILTLLAEIMTTLGDRRSVLAREMTKLHEEFLRGRASEIAANLRQRAEIKGECTLLVGGCEADETDLPDPVAAEIAEAVSSRSRRPSEISREIAEKYGVSKKKVYEQVLRLKRLKSNE